MCGNCKEGMCGKEGCCSKKGCAIKIVAKVLVIIGGINWGLVGLGMFMGKSTEGWNIVHQILKSLPSLEALIYVVVGIAAVKMIFGCKCMKGKCEGGKCGVEVKPEATPSQM